VKQGGEESVLTIVAFEEPRKLREELEIRHEGKGKGAKMTLQQTT